MMPDLCFHTLDRAGLTILAAWFEKAELARRVSPPTEQWFQYVTAGQGNFAWLVSENAQPIGLVQLDTYADGTSSISLVVNPAIRSRGYGKRILRAFLLQEAARRLDKIEAFIEADNSASLRCFSACGFAAVSPEPDADGLLTYAYC